MPNRAGPARCLRGVRGGKQGLARHAAEVQAVAAHPVALDQRHAQAELRGDRGDREAGGACPDHRQIEIRHRDRFHRRQTTGSRDKAASPISGPRMRGEKITERSGLSPARQHVAEAGADRGEDEVAGMIPMHRGAA